MNTANCLDGGDVDFANQRSWLVSQGYERIISDSDFPIEDKLSKWGVHDHIVANRLLADLRKEQNTKQPMLRVFQTSSSHEPFDVPYSRLKEEARKNGKPDILIIIMESFANDIMPSVGTHKDVAVCLDSIAQKGIFFPRFYSNTFRTDRGLVAVLSGYPAQPTTSIMR